VVALGIAPGGRQQLAGHVEAHAEHGQQAWCGLGDEQLEVVVEIADLLVEDGDTSGQAGKSPLAGCGGIAQGSRSWCALGEGRRGGCRARGCPQPATAVQEGGAIKTTQVAAQRRGRS